MSNKWMVVFAQADRFVVGERVRILHVKDGWIAQTDTAQYVASGPPPLENGDELVASYAAAGDVGVIENVGSNGSFRDGPVCQIGYRISA